MRREILTILLFTSLPLLCFTTNASASNTKMRGPEAHRPASGDVRQVPTSPSQTALLGSIRFYQIWLSPIGGNRCGFRPTCSRFGYEAIEGHGAIVGLMMTADRLMRCNIWKEPGPDYMLLPTGKLYDPVSKNLLQQK